MKPAAMHLLAGILFIASLGASSGSAPPLETPAVAPAPPAPAPDDKIASYLSIGETRRGQGDWDSAELAFQKALHSNPAPDQEIAALLGLARTYRGKEDLTKACALYGRIIADYPASPLLPAVYLESGRCLRMLGAHRFAISRFYSVINATLKIPQEGASHYRQLARTAQYEIAETYFQAGDYEQAHRFFSRLDLLDLAPADRARAAFRAAWSLTLAGDHDKAIPHLRNYLSLYPSGADAAEARYLLAVSLRQLGRTQESLAAALDLLRIEKARGQADAQNWAYWQRRTGNQLANTFYEEGDTASALAIYRTLHRLGGPLEWTLPLLYQIGLCQERLRLPLDARASYQSILDTLRAARADKPAEAARLDDLATMAEWRLRHLDWLDQTDRHLVLFIHPSHHAPPPAPQ